MQITSLCSLPRKACSSKILSTKNNGLNRKGHFVTRDGQVAHCVRAR